MRLAPVLLLLAACSDKRVATTPPPGPVAATPDAIVAAPGGTHRLAVGWGYGCVRTHDAKLSCWGRTFPATPTVIAGVEQVAGVVAGQATMCAWTEAGTVFCSAGGPAEQVQGIDDAIELAMDSSAFTTCARRRSGRVACWQPDFQKVPTAVDVPAFTGALEIVMLGHGLCARDADGVQCTENLGVAPQRVIAAADAVRLGGGGHVAVALFADRPPMAWRIDQGAAVKLPALAANTQQIVMASDLMCASGERVRCWSLDKPEDAFAIPGLANITELRGSSSLSCAIADERVLCWGQPGSLADGSTVFDDTPTPVWQLTDAVGLSGGPNSERTCARRADNSTVCWGNSITHQGQVDAVPVPATKDDDAPVICPTGGATCTTAWSGAHHRSEYQCERKGKAIACEAYFHGRHDDDDDWAPTDDFGSLTNARDLRLPSNGMGFACVAGADGRVQCVEQYMSADQLDVVPGLTDVIQLAAYGDETCALERRGTVVCWNEADRAWNGAMPRCIGSLVDIVEIVGGNVTACARHKSGAVSCWGDSTLRGDNGAKHLVAPLEVAVGL